MLLQFLGTETGEIATSLRPVWATMSDLSQNTQTNKEIKQTKLAQDQAERLTVPSVVKGPRM